MLLFAQCVMCYRTAAAQQLERSRVLDHGIIVLLIPPLLILFGLLWMARARGLRATRTVAVNSTLKPEPHLQNHLPRIER